MTLVLFIVSLLAAFLAFQSLKHKKEVVAYETFLLNHVESQHQKLDKDYRRFKNSLEQI